MAPLKLRFPILMIMTWFYSSWQRQISLCLIMLACLFLLNMPPALAGLNDDHFDGNIFVLYGGNGSLVPPKVTLAESLKRDRPTLMVFYVDDSSDCKQYAIVVSRIQAFYGRAADLIPVNVDAIPIKSTYTPTEPGYYYKGFVPQVLVFDQAGKVVLDKKGQVPYEQVDDTFRELFNLLPRSESVELKRRPVNEFNTELAK
ncbi:MAG: thylakoid membrane photosystem I accumulation factor [Chroococcidiopsidaceae cyanobacterium CP_BM_ER_R8_30]|nr:thylakoid membrane photosystem I accumulation factor [Chroococcidiopsidaceae cyanobacterium CP_BM_ER_R8_30]